MTDRFSAFRLALAGALTLGVQFVLCWLAAILWPQGPSHMFIAIFTEAPVESLPALYTGGAVALLAGAVTGLLLAWTYNLTAARKA